MSEIQERLRDALSAAARTVDPAALRPFPADTKRLRGAPPPARRRPGLLVPIAAAAAVALIVGLAFAVTRSSGPAPGRRSPPGPSPTMPAPTRQPTTSPSPTGQPPARPVVPRFYVTDNVGYLSIFATATGGLTATLRRPPPPGTFLANVAAAPDDRTFVALFDGLSGNRESRLYMFRLTGSGQVSGFSPVKGGVVPGAEGGPVAVSPDASKVALALDGLALDGKGAAPPKIVIIDVRTGVQSVWQGGFGYWASIYSLSWTRDGRSLVFEAEWCSRSLSPCRIPASYQVRSLDPASGGGRLDAGPVLLSEAQFPGVAYALISPDGARLTALAYQGPGYAPGQNGSPKNLSVVQISAATGTVVRVLFRATSAGPISPFFSADLSGQYVLFCLAAREPGATFQYGWLDGSQFRPLETGGDVMAMAW